VSKQKTLPRYLLEIPLFSQISVCTVFFILCIVMANVPYIAFKSPLLFVVPLVLASWIFHWRGLYICLFCLLFALLFYDRQVFRSLLHVPSAATIQFLMSIVILFVIGQFVCAQRDTFDLAEEAWYQLCIVSDQQAELNRIKDQFIQNVNHELRTPLTAIYGYLELLLEHEEQIDVEMRRLFLGHAMQSCDELQLLVNNVLDSMSDISGRRISLHVEEVPMLDVVNEVLERFDPQTLHDHPVTPNIPEYVVVLANPQYVRQVVRNLLSNAFKYCPVDSPIFISAKLLGDVVDPSHPSPEICVSVEDRGPGIPPNEISLLFGQFVRLHRDVNGDVRGSGLGLFLSKQFVEAMEGRIWVESEGIAGKGATFYFTLPCVVRPHTKVLKPVAEILPMG
jgi:signal transduction histidine kinase